MIAFAAFTMLTGARGCSFEAGSYEYDGYVDTPYAGGGTTYVSPPPVSGWVGDLALTIATPGVGALTPATESVRVTIRQGSAFGPVVYTEAVPVDYYGEAAVDIYGLDYGFYDLEIVGLDYYGQSVSHAATGLTIDSSIRYTTVQLEPVSFGGDVTLDVYEPDGGYYAGPIDTIDYSLWEYDPSTGQYIIVEELSQLPYSPWDAITIGNLGLGDYYIEVFAYDVWGSLIYDFNAEFAHSASLTVLPVTFQYAY